MAERRRLKVGIGGFGAIGRKVAAALDAGIEGLELAALSARRREEAAQRMQGFRRPVPVVALADLAEMADVVVECVPAAAFDAIALPAIERGRIFMPLSVGQLLPRMHLVERARATGARILVPTGALLGLDAVRAVAEGEIHSVRMVTRKPPRGLAGAPYLVERGIAVEGLTAPKKVFEGTAREGAKGFPANVNVAAALSLAGIGPDRTMLEIWADPTVERNTHRIEVEADSARFTLEIANVPSEENPRTGKNTALSVIAALRGLTGTLKVGT
jgi:aspartate dehydrogenase